MKDIHLLTALWCEPWLIEPKAHGVLCEVINRHIAQMPASPVVAREVEEEGTNADGIARIAIQGMLARRVSDIQKSSGVTDLNDIRRKIGEAVENASVRAILLDVDSGGGIAGGVPETARIIRDAAKRKPIVAFCAGDMCSAAYWLGCAADAVVCEQSARVGSIGVYCALLDESRAMEMQGVRPEIIKHGKFKAMGVRGHALTDDERALMQARCDEVYTWFSDFVIAQRPGVPTEAMEGQTFFGEEAKRNHLVDEVAGEDEALALLRDLVMMR